MKTIIHLLVLLLPCLAYAEAPDDFAQYWRFLSPGEKVAYLDGYKAGIADAFLETVSVLHSPEYKSNLPARDQFPVLGILEVEDMDILSKVISNLYEDPANSYIQLNDIIRVAKDKIAGKLTESALQSARSKALRAHELKHELMRKEK